jgi:purine-nucleoside/S-methyl-5'-thioadenosine phosphorylase / adenosine deaminase
MTPPFGEVGSEWIVPDWPAPPGVRALITTRAGGVSKVPYAGPNGTLGMNVGYGSGDAAEAVTANRERLGAVLPASPRWLRQVHGAHVVDAALVDRPVEADASFTDRLGTVIAVMIADCMPVLLTDDDGRCVAVAHAGWRGLAAGILQTTVKAMRERVGRRARLLAYLGPAIGPDHFEVGSEVRDAMTAGLAGAPAAFVAHGAGKFRADLFALGRLALAEQGVAAVYGGGVCTHCDADRFYSYRRDRITGRHAALIWRVPA